MTDYKNIDIINLALGLEKVAQQTALAPDRIRALAIQYLDKLIDPSQSITADIGGIKAENLQNLDTLLDFLKNNNVKSYGKSIVVDATNIAETDQSDIANDPAYIQYNNMLINKEGIKNYLGHLHNAMVNDPIHRPLLDKIISEVNTELEINYTKSKQQTNQTDKQTQSAEPATQQQNQQQEMRVIRTAIDELPLDTNAIDFIAIKRWADLVGQIPTMQRANALRIQVLQDADGLSNMSGTGGAPIGLTTTPDAIYTNVKNNAMGSATAQGRPYLAIEAPLMFLQKLLVFINNTKNLILAFGSGIPQNDYVRDTIERQVRLGDNITSKVYSWINAIPRVQEAIDGRRQ